jgi:hypothetical protein
MKGKRVVLKRTKSGAKELKSFPKRKVFSFWQDELIGFKA